MNYPKPQLLISNKQGKIYSVPYLESCGMKAGIFFKLRPDDLIKLPGASQLFMMPDRLPVAYSPDTDDFVILDTNPVTKKKNDCFAVSAFVSPGHTITHNAAYKELSSPAALPLYSYCAVTFYKGEFYAPALRIDKEPRHDPRFIDLNQVRRKAALLKKQFANNRLITHLSRCALVYGCPGAQNFFLSRYEGPLPVSPRCNASCAGCISFQKNKKIPPAQPRIKFVPTPQELAEVALFHIEGVRNTVVSFGQGCEGEPLLYADVIEKAIRLIRQNTSKGTININTNASRPRQLSRLFDAGLNSIRVSMNSTRQEYYTRYYKPKGYGFNDVVESIKVAKKKHAFVSMNYLTMPGFTDFKDEFVALEKFIGQEHIDMIQWRNLNFDPLEYFKIVKSAPKKTELLGIKEIIQKLKMQFPKLKMGYYNPVVKKL